MKRIGKHISGLALTGLLLTGLISTADAQRGFHGGGFRGGFHSGVGFHGGVGWGLGFHGGGYFGYPHIGVRIGVLPFGYYPFYWGPDLYYYYGGAFYRPYDGGYQVTVPPLGAAVPKLPDGAQSIVIDSQQYYEFQGVYYKEGVDDKGKKVYIISGRDGVLNTDGANVDNNAPPAPQVGDIVNQLPEGCRKIKLNGKTYYVAPDDVYYEQFKDNYNNKAYRIASVPEAQPDSN